MNVKHTSTGATELWPALPYGEWNDTATTLQLMTQIVGKIRLARTPWLNHSWHVTLYVSAVGLATSPIYVDGTVLEIEFDFLSQQLHFRTSRGDRRAIPLKAQPISAFYRAVFSTLDDIGLPIAIDPMPNEIADAIPFPDDHVHRAYDADAAQRFWRALVQVDRVLKRFRTGFIGKCSPVHFFWGSFDLAVTRFSGRTAPPHPGGVPNLPDDVAREAYSHEVSSAGFWPGNATFPQAAFYSYAYPEPPGFRDRAILPSAASFNPQLGEFILPYDAVRLDTSPDDALMAFLQSTYQAAADTAKWDRHALECAFGSPGHCRQLSD
ncbi:DUF5996 family protein [Microvirga terricola]|uniref:Ava_C0101 and related proteins n=1 Tax=Microvirga terricola TaxID=2719797 RepID=A0ABX0VE21_9HYPH|nr:DUF5996 family protein [Microvirga terricola]NIX78077.1 hypothetical protein [Microvirga terricola]